MEEIHVRFYDPTERHRGPCWISAEVPKYGFLPHKGLMLASLESTCILQQNMPLCHHDVVFTSFIKNLFNEHDYYQM